MKRNGFWAAVRNEVARLQRLQAAEAVGGAVYYIGSGEDGPVKIGLTGGAVEKRLRALQTGNSEKLHVVSVFPGRTQAQERQLHANLDAFRLQGEWFMPEVLVLLESIENWCPTERSHRRDDARPEILDGTRPEVVVDTNASYHLTRAAERSLALTAPCPTCRAQIGEQCQTVTWPGQRRRRAHGPRMHEVRMGWLEVHGREASRKWARERRRRTS